MSKISELFDYAFSDTEIVYKEINFGSIKNADAQKIKQETGIYVRGMKLVISTDSIIHTMGSHGNDKLEKERGQIGITKSDFDLICNLECYGI